MSGERETAELSGRLRASATIQTPLPYAAQGAVVPRRAEGVPRGPQSVPCACAFKARTAQRHASGLGSSDVPYSVATISGARRCSEAHPWLGRHPGARPRLTAPGRSWLERHPEPSHVRSVEPSDHKLWTRVRPDRRSPNSGCGSCGPRVGASGSQSSALLLTTLSRHVRRRSLEVLRGTARR